MWDAVMAMVMNEGVDPWGTTCRFKCVNANSVRTHLIERYEWRRRSTPGDQGGNQITEPYVIRCIRGTDTPAVSHLPISLLADVHTHR